MAPNTFAAVGGGPGGEINPEAVRPADPQYWARKTMAKDLQNAKLFLQHGLLTADTLNNFDLWKEDIVRAVKSVSLTSPEHWTTFSRLIYDWLDDGNYQTISSFIPDNYNELRVIHLVKLLQRIEAQLVTADQLEYKKLHFELAH